MIQTIAFKKFLNRTSIKIRFLIGLLEVDGPAGEFISIMLAFGCGLVGGEFISITSVSWQFVNGKLSALAAARVRFGGVASASTKLSKK